MKEKYEEEGILYRSWLRAGLLGEGGSSAPSSCSPSYHFGNPMFTEKETVQPDQKGMGLDKNRRS